MSSVKIRTEKALESTRISLKTFRWKKNPPHVWVSGDWLVISAPTYFGEHEWRLPLDEVAVVDTRDSVGPVTDNHPQEQVDRSVEFTRDLLIPYLATTASLLPPTSGLLFRRPQRVPPVRAAAVRNPMHPFPFRAKATRSREGAFVDGILLREVEPGQLADVASSHGMEMATGLEWFNEHRSTTDREGVEPLTVGGKIIESAGLVSAAAGGGLWWMGGTPGFSSHLGRIALIMVLGGAGVAAVTDRMATRRAHSSARREGQMA